MLSPTLVLDDIFYPAKGWTFPSHQVPRERGGPDDGNPYKHLRVDGFDVIVFEQTEWAEQHQSSVSPNRLCVTVPSDLPVGAGSDVGEINSRTLGLPALAEDEDGALVLVGALPFADGFPVDWLRKHLLVGNGVGVEQMRQVLAESRSPTLFGPDGSVSRTHQGNLSGTHAGCFEMSSGSLGRTHPHQI